MKYIGCAPVALLDGGHGFKNRPDDWIVSEITPDSVALGRDNSMKTDNMLMAIRWRSVVPFDFLFHLGTWYCGFDGERVTNLPNVHFDAASPADDPEIVLTDVDQIVSFMRDFCPEGDSVALSFWIIRNEEITLKRREGNLQLTFGVPDFLAEKPEAVE